jgi:hypothetical protein
LNYNGPKSNERLPGSGSAGSLGRRRGSAPNTPMPAALGTRPTLRPPPMGALETYEPPSQLAKRRAALEFPPPQFEVATAPKPIRGSTPSSSVDAPPPSYGYTGRPAGMPAFAAPRMEGPLDRSFSTTSRRPAPWPSSIPPVAMPSSAPSMIDPTVPTRPRRTAYRFTCLFAGIIAGILLGMLAFVPAVRARAAALVHPSDPEATPPPAASAEVPPPLPSASTVMTAPTAPPVAPIVIAPPAPEPGIDGDHTLVSFAPALKGKRVAVDGRILSTTTPPLRLRCGKHMLKVAGSPKRPIELPCGRSSTLE